MEYTEHGYLCKYTDNPHRHHPHPNQNNRKYNFINRFTTNWTLLPPANTIIIVLIIFMMIIIFIMIEMLVEVS